ncbi:HNH endonuclease [Petrimonas sp.]|uniref:HNH endonuclease n=1 Tax=Petrimonas sp. TaxID=2023866 RepID=UPI003F513096
MKNLKNKSKVPVFRIKHPQRRNITRLVNSYSDHKNDLRIDFHQHCGYCDCWDKFKTTYFEIDHFIPENILTIMPKTDYRNLVYSCRSCNNAKRAKWPTENENIHNQNNQGFIDPCHDNYALQFERTDNGEIKWTTELGKWMFITLKLGKPQHAIIWQLEQLDDIIAQIRQIIDENPNHYLKDKLLKMCLTYIDYENQLRSL